ncbi:MAG: proline--tRNA ligase [candidate division WOR-3 bacterium]|nr:proline--tRNA ligase [candidate division WOR-3 bacterium]
MKDLVKKSENFSEWYTQVIVKAELADYAPVRGCMVIRPYGYNIWENIQRGLDKRFKETGHQNAYFPLFIPESFLKKEAEHVKGFAPQVAWVLKGGEEDLQERLAVRPTSEAIICSMYAKWVKSYRDLPILINQWCNIVRWEKTTRLFLRTTEFLWQEGHTLHQTFEEAEKEAKLILNIYIEFLKEELALPVIAGLKPPSERFAGALRTYTIEALMPDGQALQSGTTHNLGQNFSKAFNIKFLDKDNKEKYPWGSSWGVSTRLIGALIMSHGDDNGLILPPQIAPIQIVIIPILYGKDEEIIRKCENLKEELKKEFRVYFDNRKEYTPGWKFNEWELKGVPLRIEIGKKELENEEVRVVSRDYQIKENIKWANLKENLKIILDKIQKNLYLKAENFLKERIFFYEELVKMKEEILEKKGMAKIFWCGKRECEEKIKDETKTTPRCIPLEKKDEGKCIVCGKKTKLMIYYARAY